MPRRTALLLVLLATVIAPLASGAERDHQLQTADYRFSLSARTPEQIGAFYEARGFPASAVDLLKQQCYLTVYFHNTGTSPTLLDQRRWHFTTPTGEVPRLDRTYWQRRWQQEGLEQRFQSTFRWTLLPEALDFQPDEREGGNVILPYTEGPMDLEVTLQRPGRPDQTLTLRGILCAR